MATRYSFVDDSGETRLSGTLSPDPATEALTPASLDASNLPTADPMVAGQVWSDSGVLTVSAG